MYAVVFVLAAFSYAAESNAKNFPREANNSKGPVTLNNLKHRPRRASKKARACRLLPMTQKALDADFMQPEPNPSSPPAPRLRPSADPFNRIDIPDFELPQQDALLESVEALAEESVFTR